MKRTQFLIPAVLIALLALALAGPAGASATSTAWCKKLETTCAAGNIWPLGTVVTGVTKNTPIWPVTDPAKWVTNVGTVECDSSFTMTSTGTNATESGGMPTQITNWNFLNCKITTGGEEGFACSATTRNLPYKATTEAAVSGNGTLTFESGGAGSPGVTVECGAVINCTFSNASMAFPLTGGEVNVGNAKAVEITMGRAGAKCPTSVKLSATYYFGGPVGGVYFGM